jgi:hypothetical protein
LVQDFKSICLTAQAIVGNENVETLPLKKIARPLGVVGFMNFVTRES